MRKRILPKYDGGVGLLFKRILKRRTINDQVEDFGSPDENNNTNWSLTGKDNYGNYTYEFSPDYEIDSDAYEPYDNVLTFFKENKLKMPTTEWLNDKINKDEIWKVYKKQLPEVTVTPQIPNVLNSLLYQSLLDEDYDKAYPRLLEIYNAAGRPKVLPLSKHPNPDPEKRYIDDGKTLRAYTDIDNIYINTLDDAIAELSHPILEKYGNNGTMSEHMYLGGYDADKDPRGGSRYMYPDRYEGETHYDFEPMLKQYLFYNTIPTRYLHTSHYDLDRNSQFLSWINSDRISGKTVYMYPKNLEEVLDSAASYNAQRQKAGEMYYKNDEHDMPIISPHYKNYKIKTEGNISSLW